MATRMLVWVLLINAACATIAPAGTPAEHSQPAGMVSATPPEEIDIDAMARAKDVGAQSQAPAATPVSTDAAVAPAQAQADQAAKADAAASESAAAEHDSPSADGAAQSGASESAASTQAETVDPSSVPMSPQALPANTSEPKPDPKRAAACTKIAQRLIDAMLEADYKGAVRDFDSTMRTALPAEKLQQAWATLDQFGPYQARGQTHAKMMEGYLAITIPLIFEKRDLYAQIACGSDGRIAGFYIKPLDTSAR